MISLLIFIFGLIIGSFLNVVILRLHASQSIAHGRSKCPQCQKMIKWYDNIPLLSFIWLRRRCRNCEGKISWFYPIIELATALIFLWFYFTYGLTFWLIRAIIFGAFLIVIFVFDFRYYLILDVITIPAMVVALVINWYLEMSLIFLALGALIGGGFFLIQFVISKGRWIGGGDIRLGVLMGLMLGWQVTLLALFLAYIAGALVGIVLIALGQKKMSSQLPFGTFLTAATLISLVYGNYLVNWYVIWTGL